MKLKLSMMLLLVFVCVGCQSDKPPADDAILSDSVTRIERDDNFARVLSSPSDYFPTDVGRTWTYSIKLKSMDYDDAPLNHSVTKWLRPDNRVKVVSVRGILYTHDEKVKNLKLVLRVKDRAEKQGPLKYPEGYEIEVVRDDLRIFKDNQALFWAITHSGRYSAEQIMMCDPNSPGSMSDGPWGNYGQIGYSHRILFFGDEPGTQIGLAREDDALLFNGPEIYDGIKCLHFTRRVEKSKKEDYNQFDPPTRFDASFDEDMWYAKNIGLVKLIQTVDGMITMTWDLER